MKTYIIGVAEGKSFEWQSDQENPVEIISEFLEKTEEEQFYLGLLISCVEKGKDEEYFVLSEVVLANIGDFDKAELLVSMRKFLE